MKRIVLLGLCVWLLAIGKTIATNTVTVESVTVPRGGQATMEITYSIDDAYEGYQLQLQMAEGSKVRPVMLGGKPVMTIDYDATHSLTCSSPSDNLYNAVCVSFQEGDDKILASSGTLMSVLLEADEDATGTYNATLKGIKFAKTGNVEVNLANVEITITVTDALSLVTLNEESTTFSIEQEKLNVPVDVTVNRTINANEWSTICLPFAMSETQVKLAFGSDVLLKDFTGWSFEGSAPAVDKITINFSDAIDIAINHPYIIKVSSDITSFQVKNVIITPETYPSTDNIPFAVTTGSGKQQTTTTYYGQMYGYYAKCTMDPNELFLSGNKFWYNNGNTTIKGFRGTFYFKDGSNNLIRLSSYTPSSRIVMSFNEEETTGIRDNKRITTNGKTYNLSGQQVEKPSKGLYIQDGKKVIIK